MAQAKTNLYFPCTMIEHEDYYSIVCSNFHFFDDYFGDKGGGGYSVEKLAKKLVKQASIPHIRFDSEAGMFCAYSNWKTPLKDLCKELRRLTGPAAKHLTAKAEPTISLARAEKLLLRGFVVSLDTKSQREFLKHVPCPPLSKQQTELIRKIKSGSDAEKIKAARRINSEGRTRTRDWNNFLSHPWTTELLLNQFDVEANQPKVQTELLWAVSSICGRHLPDLRAEPYFRDALYSRLADMRKIGLSGLSDLQILKEEDLKPLLKDKSKSVRESARWHSSWLDAEESAKEFPSWMFDNKAVQEVQVAAKTKPRKGTKTK